MSEKVYNRRKKIVEILSTNDYSVTKLGELVNASRRTIESDINALRKDGNEIKINKDIVSLNKLTGAICRSSVQIVRQTKILMLLSNNPKGLTKKEITEKIIISLADEGDSENFYEALRKRIDFDLSELIKNKKIFFIVSKKNLSTSNSEGKYFLSLNTKTQIQFGDYNLKSIYEKLVDSCDINSYGDILFQITQKIYWAVDNKIYGEKIERIEPLILQNKKNEYSKYEKKLIMLFSVNYKSKKIVVDYVDRHGVKISKIIEVGAIVLLTSSGSFYLLGKEENRNNKNLKFLCVIELSRVEAIVELEEENTEFGKLEYKKICEEMYRISIEKAVEVVYRYDCTDENIEKIKRQKQLRDTISYEIDDEIILCKDTIRGSFDFCKFLRGEGNNVFVVSPHSISKLMRDSAEKILERYMNEQ